MPGRGYFALTVGCERAPDLTKSPSIASTRSAATRPSRALCCSLRFKRGSRTV